MFPPISRCRRDDSSSALAFQKTRRGPCRRLDLTSLQNLKLSEDPIQQAYACVVAAAVLHDLFHLDPQFLPHAALAPVQLLLHDWKLALRSSAAASLLRLYAVACWGF